MGVKPGYRETEGGIIPEDWDVKPLGELGNFKNGINKPKEDFGFGYPFVNLMDVFGIQKIDSIKKLGLINTTAEERYAYSLSIGDVIFVRSSVKPEGVGLTTLIAAAMPDTVYSGFLIRFRPSGKLDASFCIHCFHASSFRKSLIESSTISANTNINQDALKALQLVHPVDLGEQQAIASALSDTDDLIAALEALIAKKQAIKQGAMQELLTGRKRLPGFKGEWEEKQLGDVLTVRHGRSQHTVVISEGGFPIFATGGEIGRSSEFLYDKPSVLIGRKGTIDEPRFAAEPFWTIDTLFYTEIKRGNDAKFVYYLFKTIDWLSFNEASGVPSLNASTIESIEKCFPGLQEQQAIASILSDMDSEIAQLEDQLGKARALKQGMMQELLTGRIRLV